MKRIHPLLLGIMLLVACFELVLVMIFSQRNGWRLPHFYWGVVGSFNFLAFPSIWGMITASSYLVYIFTADRQTNLRNWIFNLVGIVTPWLLWLWAADRVTEELWSYSDIWTDFPEGYRAYGLVRGILALAWLECFLYSHAVLVLLQRSDRCEHCFQTVAQQDVVHGSIRLPEDPQETAAVETSTGQSS